MKTFLLLILFCLFLAIFASLKQGISGSWKTETKNSLHMIVFVLGGLFFPLLANILWASCVALLAGISTLALITLSKILQMLLGDLPATLVSIFFLAGFLLLGVSVFFSSKLYFGALIRAHNLAKTKINESWLFKNSLDSYARAWWNALFFFYPALVMFALIYPKFSPEHPTSALFWDLERYWVHCKKDNKFIPDRYFLSYDTSEHYALKFTSCAETLSAIPIKPYNGKLLPSLSLEVKGEDQVNKHCFFGDNINDSISFSIENTEFLQSDLYEKRGLKLCKKWKERNMFSKREFAAEDIGRTL